MIEAAATSLFYDVMPHRPPMVWVDEVISSSRSEKGLAGVCVVRLGQDRPYHREGGKIRSTSVLEWIAQSYGYVKAHEAKNSSAYIPMTRAFLAGISQCEVSIHGIENEEELLVEVADVRDLAPAYLIRGRVLGRNSKHVYGSAQLKLFADPGNIVDSAKEGMA
jgi:predicted hotdog family 3-hydroxylacyl-ACP dehydratase